MYYLKTHLRVISAFIMREVATRYGRSPGGYIWAFLEPIAYIFMMSLLMSAFGRMPAEGESFMLFYATGYLSYSFYKMMEGYLTSSISANKSLFSYPVVAPIDAFIARFILQGATSVLVTFVIITAALVQMRHVPSLNWPQILEAILFAWIMAAGVALINIVLFAMFPLYQKIFDIVTRPLLLLSGVFYVPADMPHPMSDIFLHNPITHIIILFREGFYGGMGTDGLDVPFLAETSLAVLFVGMTLFTFWPVARRRD